jgi:hypothetical protein
MPARSSVLVGCSSRSSSEPSCSNGEHLDAFDHLAAVDARRPRAVGRERSGRLSGTTSEGSTLPFQVSCHSEARDWRSRRHRPSRIQQVKVQCSLDGRIPGVPWHLPAAACRRRSRLRPAR